MRRWWAWLGIILATGPVAGAVHAEYRGGTIRIGVLNDQSGLYADIAGTGSIWIARKAVEDFGAAAKSMRVEILCGEPHTGGRECYVPPTLSPHGLRGVERSVL